MRRSRNSDPGRCLPIRRSSGLCSVARWKPRATWAFDGAEPPIFAEAEDALTRAQSAAVSAFLSKNALKPSDIGVVGFHGQTMLHRAPTPARLGQTRQLGDGALMARLVGTNVAYDFRTADMAAGGQGAPLAASYHVALLRRLGSDRKAAVLNLGGVSNVTWWDGDAMVAFDTGPANAPLNDWIRQHGLGDMDRDELGAKGKVHEERLARLLTHPYLSAPSPKSLDRNDFTAAMAEGLSAEDGAATLTAFTAGRGREGPRHSADAAGAAHSLRWGPTQSDAGGSHSSACEGRTRPRRGCWLARRCGGGRVLRLPGGSHAARACQSASHERQEFKEPMAGGRLAP